MDYFSSTYFVQDGAPCHASNRIKDVLGGQPFQILDWPGNSPDLNQVENMKYMEEKLKDKKISSAPKLIHESRCCEPWASPRNTAEG
jgi:hypothetical protein